MRGHRDRDYRDPGAQTYGRESFRANAFYSELADWEIAFAHNPPRDLPAVPQGDALALARQMMDKYKPVLEKAYDPEYQKRLAADLADAERHVLAGVTQVGK